MWDGGWDGGCHIGSKHHSVVNTTIQNNNLHRYGCGTASLSCSEKSCWHGSTCVYYLMWLEPIGPRATVYKKASKGWYVDLEFTYKNLTETKHITVRDTTYNMHNFMDFEQKISFDFSEPSFEEGLLSDMIINDANIYYEAYASPLDHPTQKLLGDVQINLNSQTSAKNMKYPVFDIKCYTSSCYAHCPTPVPQLETFRYKVRGGFTQPLKKFEVFKNSIMVYQQSFGVVPMTIGNLDVKNAILTQGNCEIHVVEKYACYGCNSRPYIKLQASTIVTDGTMQFNSNCTFTKPYISCGESDYVLEYHNYNEYCRIEIPTTNTSFVVFNKEIFEGKVHFHHERGSVSTTRAVNPGSIFSSHNFIDTFSAGFWLISISTIGVPILAFIFKQITTCVTSRNVVHTIERLA